MRVCRVLSLAGVIILIAQLCMAAGPPKGTQVRLMNEAMKAIEAGRAPVAKEKLTELLQLDRDNFEVLLLLGQLEMSDLGGADVARRVGEAENYFLQAAIAQPQRPEPYLGLAALLYAMGNFDRGDHYARIAQNMDPKSYESYCLLGQRYEDSGNFTGALEQYQRALKSYRFDPYLTERRYLASVRGGLQPEWTYAILGRGKRGPAATKEQATQSGVLLLRRFPDFYLLNDYRQEAGRDPAAAKRYALPYLNSDYCPRDVVPPNPYKDLYEAFIKASTADPAQYRRLRSELDRIRREALQAVANVRGVNAKGKALYKWLKANVLKQYDAQEGAFAQGILDKKKYTSLSGTLLYALLATEAGLPVTGTVTAGHALALLDDGRRKIPVDVAAGIAKDVPEEGGFDAVWWDQFKMRDILDDMTVPQGSLGAKTTVEVNPAGLTAYQFLSANEQDLSQVNEKFKEETAYKRTLEEALIQRNREAATRMASIRARLYSEPDKMKIELDREERKVHEDLARIQLELGKVDVIIEKEKARYYSEKGLNLLRAARALAPRLQEVIDREEDAYEFIATAEARPALQGIDARTRMRRDAEKRLTLKLDELELEKFLSGTSESSMGLMLQQGIASTEAEITNLDGLITRDWQIERAAWLKALTVLERGMQELPCSDRLRKRFEAMCWTAMSQAEKSRDYATADEVARIGAARLPNSEFARQYRERRLGGL